MAQLTNAQYEILERAVIDGTRIAFRRSGRRETIVIPQRLRLLDRREAVEARHPTTGQDLTIYLDDIESFEVVR
jgi:hypothetical protein